MSLFGSGFGAAPQQQQQSSSLFGNNTQQQPQPQQPLTGLFGSATAQPAAGQSSSSLLFGSNSPSSLFGSSAPPAGASMFGNNPQGTATGGGLFGSTAPASTGLMFGSSNPQPATSGSGLFGSTAQPATAGSGLFGSTGSAQPATTGSGLFGQPATTAGTGLFGSGTSQPSASGSGLFGTTASAQPAATTGSGLFGTGTSQTGSGGLFGTTASAQPATAAGTGLFGSSQPAAAAATTTTTATGLFGSSTSQPATATGLFGSSTSQPTATTATGLFGSSTSQPAAATATTGTGLFGSSTSQPTATTGTGLFGSSQPTATATTGLFGASAATKTDSSTAAPPAAVNSLFDSTPSGGGATTTTPPSPFGSASLAPAATSLFGQVTKPAETGGGLLGAAVSLTGSAGGLFGAAKSGSAASGDAKPAEQSASIFGSSSAEGNREKNEKRGRSSIFGGDLFGGSQSGETAKAAKGDGGAPKPAGLFDRLFDKQAPAPAAAGGAALPEPDKTAKAPVWGISVVEEKKDAPKPAEPSKPATETPPPSGLAMVQHAKFKTVLADWDQKLRRQIADFDKYSATMISFDNDLFGFVKTMEQIQSEQSDIQVKQMSLLDAVEALEADQLNASRMLTNMENSLRDRMPPSHAVTKSAIRAKAIYHQLDELDRLADELTIEVEKVQAMTYTHGLSQLLGSLESHKQHITFVAKELETLKEGISEAEDLSVGFGGNNQAGGNLGFV